MIAGTRTPKGYLTCVKITPHKSLSINIENLVEKSYTEKTIHHVNGKPMSRYCFFLISGKS